MTLPSPMLHYDYPLLSIHYTDRSLFEISAKAYLKRNPVNGVPTAPNTGLYNRALTRWMGLPGDGLLLPRCKGAVIQARVRSTLQIFYILYAVITAMSLANLVY